MFYRIGIPNNSSGLIPMSICTLQFLFCHSFSSYEWRNWHCDVQMDPDEYNMTINIEVDRGARFAPTNNVMQICHTSCHRTCIWQDSTKVVFNSWKNFILSTWNLSNIVCCIRDLRKFLMPGFDYIVCLTSIQIYKYYYANNNQFRFMSNPSTTQQKRSKSWRKNSVYPTTTKYGIYLLVTRSKIYRMDSKICDVVF
jgi:hypothetical protein